MKQINNLIVKAINKMNEWEQLPLGLVDLINFDITIYRIEAPIIKKVCYVIERIKYETNKY